MYANTKSYVVCYTHIYIYIYSLLFICYVVFSDHRCYETIQSSVFTNTRNARFPRTFRLVDSCDTRISMFSWREKTKMNFVRASGDEV